MTPAQILHAWLATGLGIASEEKVPPLAAFRKCKVVEDGNNLIVTLSTGERVLVEMTDLRKPS